MVAATLWAGMTTVSSMGRFERLAFGPGSLDQDLLDQDLLDQDLLDQDLLDQRYSVRWRTHPANCPHRLANTQRKRTRRAGSLRPPM